MAEDTLIDSFQKNATEEVRISLTNYKGYDLIDVRIYYLNVGSEEEWKPSRRGICMQRDHMQRLLEGLKLACEKNSNEE